MDSGKAAIYMKTEARTYQLMNQNQVIAEFQLKKLPNAAVSSVLGGKFEEYEIASYGVINSELYSRVVGKGKLLDFLYGRRAPKNREHIARLLHTLNLEDLETFLEVSLGLSFTDTVWVRSKDAGLEWDRVNLYENPFSEVIAHCAFSGEGLHGLRQKSTSPEYGTDGMLPKCWVNRNNTTTLVKGGSSGTRNAGWEPFAEYYASQVLEVLDLSPFVPYELGMFRERFSSFCERFTNLRTGFVSMYRMMVAIYGEGYSLSDLAEFITSEGLQTAYDDMIFCDSILCNPDRHQGNFGLSIDNRSYGIRGMAPLFDHGLSLGILWHPENPQSIVEYTAEHGDHKITGEPFIDAGKRLLDGRRGAHLRKLVNFRLTEHARYRMPAGKLEAMNALLHHQVTEILKG